MRCMKRSRVTFAITDAAAIAALVASPPTTARCSKPVGGTGNPSDRHSALVLPDAPQHVARARRGSSCAGPRSSIPRTQREVIATRDAARSTFGYSASRISGVCCLESLSAEQRPQVAQRQRLVVEQHGGGDERTGEAAAAGLVGPGHPPEPEPAVVAGTGATRRSGDALPVASRRRSARGGRSAWEANRWRRLRR